MNYKEAMALGEKALNVAGISEAKNDAWLLLAYACKIDHTFYYLHLNDDISEEELREYENIIKGVTVESVADFAKQIVNGELTEGNR